MRLAFLLFLGGQLFAQSGDPLEFFEKKIRPILATNCYVCHGQAMQMSGLNFSSPEGLAKVVSPGDPGQSRLYRAVSYAEKIKMPPAGKLKECELRAGATSASPTFAIRHACAATLHTLGERLGGGLRPLRAEQHPVAL